MEISASLDPAVGKNLEEYIAEINAISGIGFHCDVMDGNFVERSSVTRDEYLQIMKSAKHPVDVHLMVDRPFEGKYQLSSDILPRSITFHAEAEAVPSTLVAAGYIRGIKQHGIQAGLAIDFNTPVSSIDEGLLCMCDVVTVMSVKAGKSGQQFNESALEKVKLIKKINPTARVILDGGICEENIDLVRAAGVDTAVVGSALYNALDKAKTVEMLKSL